MEISMGESTTRGCKVIEVSRLQVCKSCAGGSGIVCLKCKGELVLPVRPHVVIDFPAGVLSGHKVVVSGAGDAAEGINQEPGDLIVEIRVQPHPVLQRLGYDCHAEVSLSFVSKPLLVARCLLHHCMVTQ